MVLYFIGLGLGDERDITVKGLEIVKRCEKIYLESYTSILGISKERLSDFYGKEVLEADREFVEQEAEGMIQLAKQVDVAFLVVGDVFGATTHTDLWLRCKHIGVEVEVVHNASIMNAVASTGLQLYHFGETVSIVFFTDKWKPDSFYNKIKSNKERGQHTLCLLDIKVKEQSEENLLRRKKIYEPPRFMSVNVCIEQLLEIESIRNEKVYDENTKCFGLARIGQPTQKIVSGTFAELRNVDFGTPLHSFVIPGEMHPLEEEMFTYFQFKAENEKIIQKEESEDS